MTPGGAGGRAPRSPAAAVPMHLTVKLFAGFRAGRFDATQLERPEGTTVRAVVDELRLPHDEIGILLVRGRHAELDTPLAAGDTLSIFPRVGGG